MHKDEIKQKLENQRASFMKIRAEAEETERKAREIQRRCIVELNGIDKEISSCLSKLPD